MKMPEAEVSLRLAIHLIENNLTISDVDVAIDGAQVKTTNTIHFAISEFLATIGWKKAKDDAVWQGEYRHEKHDRKIRIHSRSGCGDVVATLSNGKILRVESKKGSLSTSKSSKEYPLLREAMGQILTYTEVSDNDILAVVVPSSPKFNELASRWRAAPMIEKIGLLILTVDRNNQVTGIPNSIKRNK
ncbi:MAG: hypothetical protein LW720_19125 [Pirellula sp.]|jgi:hypothetical protein|nr:hypothetical protein [Pirellula sp.]